MKVFFLDEIDEIIQRINDSQINAQLTWYDLEGFDYVVGDPWLGYKKTIPHKDINWLNLSSVVSDSHVTLQSISPKQVLRSGIKETVNT